MKFVVAKLLEILNAVASVEVDADLLVGLHEDFKLLIEVAVLCIQDVDVLLKGGYLKAEAGVAVRETCVRELDVVVVFAGKGDLVLASTNLGLEVKDVGLEVLATEHLRLALTDQSKAVFVASVQVTLGNGVILRLSRALILQDCKISLSSFESLRGAAEVKVTLFSDLG